MLSTCGEHLVLRQASNRYLPSIGSQEVADLQLLEVLKLKVERVHVSATTMAWSAKLLARPDAVPAVEALKKRLEAIAAACTAGEWPSTQLSQLLLDMEGIYRVPSGAYEPSSFDEAGFRLTSMARDAERFCMENKPRK